jgi:hypothetical protein
MAAETAAIMVTELYVALRKAGVDEQLASEAASAVLPAHSRAELATKADLGGVRAEMALMKAELRADMAELKSDLIKWNVGAMAMLTAIFAAISRL